MLTFGAPPQKRAKIENADVGAWLGFRLTDSGESAALFRNALPGGENKQVKDKARLSVEIRLRNKFKVVDFSLSFMAGNVLLTLHFLTFKKCTL